MREHDAGVEHFQLLSGLVYAEHGSRDGVQYKAKRNHIPLNQYLAAGHITQPQHYAGNKIYNLYLISSHLHHPVQMRYSDMASGLKEYEKKFVINQRYMEAIMSVQGGITRDTVIRVCLDSLPAKRGKMNELRQGLEDLVRFFKKEDN